MLILLQYDRKNNESLHKNCGPIFLWKMSVVDKLVFETFDMSLTVISHWPAAACGLLQTHTKTWYCAPGLVIALIFWSEVSDGIKPHLDSPVGNQVNQKQVMMLIVFVVQLNNWLIYLSTFCNRVQCSLDPLPILSLSVSMISELFVLPFVWIRNSRSVWEYCLVNQWYRV